MCIRPQAWHTLRRTERREWAGDWAGGGATAAGMGDRDNSIFALRGCLGSRRRTHVFEGLPVKGQAGSMPGYPLAILILLCEAELAYHGPGVCLGLASTVLALLEVCRGPRIVVAALIVHADGARNKGRLPTVFRVDVLGLGTQKNIR